MKNKTKPTDASHHQFSESETAISALPSLICSKKFVSIVIGFRSKGVLSAVNSQTPHDDGCKFFSIGVASSGHLVDRGLVVGLQLGVSGPFVEVEVAFNRKVIDGLLCWTMGCHAKCTGAPVLLLSFVLDPHTLAESKDGILI